MGKRKQLKNLAYGIAGRFSSRNNDVDGFWALGLLYATAAAAGTKTICLDVMTQKANPSFKHSGRLLSEYKRYMDEQLEMLGLSGHVYAATIEIEFDVDPSLVVARRDTWGEPYLAQVKLTDDLAQVRSAFVHGWCSKHNPELERRSARRYPT